MSDRVKSLLIKYGSSTLFVAVMAYAYIAMRDFAGAKTWEKMVMICDALTVPGMLLLMVGALIWVANTGALDGITYAVGFAVRALIPGGRHKDERYADYVERQREKRVKGYGFLLITGGITMAVATVFLIAYRFF